MELSLEEKELSCEKQLEKNVILSLKSRKARRAVLKEGVSILQSAELGPVGEVTERQRLVLPLLHPANTFLVPAPVNSYCNGWGCCGGSR